MVSATPSAAWHPALMPNFVANAAVHVDAKEPEKASSPLSEDAAHPEEPEPTRDPAPLKAFETSTDHDEWFPEYEAGTPMLPKNEEPAYDSPVVPNEDVADDPKAAPRQDIQITPIESQETIEDGLTATPEQNLHDTMMEEYEDVTNGPDTIPEQTEQDDAVEEPQKTSSTTAKHTSTDSFARTVSHIPNYSDDEETEFILPRAETGLFNKFMPQTTRTNSFPVVPPLKEDHEQEAVEQLPASQAEDVMNEVEHESAYFDEEAASPTKNALHQDTFWGDDGAEDAFLTQAYAGGDFQAPEEDFDTRYVEGVPLIAHPEAEPAEPVPMEEENEGHDLFAEEGDDDDDFFGQIGGTGSAEQAGFVPAQLERKSTLQVLGGLGAVAPDSPQNTLGDPLKEEDEDEIDSGLIRESAPEPETVREMAFASETTAQESQKPQGEDLATKWSEAFAGDDDDDDFLMDDSATDTNEEKAIDPSAFFGDDDEGFLEDTDDEPSAPQPPPGPVDLKTGPIAQSQPAGENARYLPPSMAQTPVSQLSNPYFPAAASPAILQPQTASPFIGTTPAPNPYAVPTSSAGALYGAPAVRPQPTKAQSFADKSKGGYSSPYDLPMDVVKPRKRQSMQQLPRGPVTPTIPHGPPPPPARSTSMYSQPPATQGPPVPILSPKVPGQMQRSGSSMSPPSSTHSNQAPSTVAKLPPQLKSKASFFEELPMSAKVRPASRTTNKGQGSPTLNNFAAPPPPGQHPPPPSMPTPPQELSMASQPGVPGISRLVTPERASPYAPVQPDASHISGLPLPGVNSRYSPAPSHAPMPNGAVPPAVASRYSPAPPAQRPGGYAPATAATPPSVLPHLPRTSSPLAHFEVSQDRPRPAPHHSDPYLQQNRSSSSVYEPRLNRVSSLPPTREVEEDETVQQRPLVERDAPPLNAAQSLAAQENQYGQVSFRSRQTPPPPPLNTYAQNTLSPPKRKISYGPASNIGMPHQISEFEPPQRSQTQSPGAMYGLRSPIKPADPIPRPLSVNEAPSASIATMVGPPTAVSSRPRGFSQNLNVIAPTDGRELDPLQRWKGTPLIHWGVGGIIVTSCPKDVPRYGMHQALPSVIRSPGEVKIKHIKDIQPLEERLAKFPGPLKGKSKKKETIAWLSIGIEGLERSLPNLSFQTEVSHEYKRAAERVLLWKILRLLVEHDGVLEGNAAVDQAVRDVLSPTLGAQNNVLAPIYAAGGNISGVGGESASTHMQADSVDSGTIEQLKKSLLSGEREQAVWTAADKRLWGHALLIANTVSPDLYHKVSQEFIKKEVNFSGHNNESLATLYAVLSGNHDECIDELVPSHARAGFQLVTKSSSTGPSTGGLEGLDKWRETLTLILSNRSAGDAKALNALGNLLSGYGRAEAAHICFLFARTASVFGGLDDPQSNFVLVGADHKRQAEQFAKETEALLLSEVYEYGLSLAGGSSVAAGAPHLAVYKLQHAMTLAEYGFRDKALQYCEALMNSIVAQTKRSPYHHILLESAVEDLRQRLREAPKEESNSWIPKPSMNKMSDSVWNRFNKFVAGDDQEGAGQGSPKAGEETGPFGRIPGGTPTISRSPSVTNVTAMDMFGTPNGYPGGAAPVPGTLSPTVTRTSSRYTPTTSQPNASPSQYDPKPAYLPSGRSSIERTSGEYNRSSLSYETRLPDVDAQPGYSNGYAPLPAQPTSYQDSGLGISNQSAYQPVPQSEGPYGQSYAPATPGYAPHAPLSQAASPYAPARIGSASPYAPASPRTNTASSFAPSMSVAENKVIPAEHETVPSPGYQPPSYGYEAPAMNQAEESPVRPTEQEFSGGYEPPSYGYEPPSYQPDSGTTNDDGDSETEAKPKKKSFMDDDDDDHFPPMKTGGGDKSKEEKDRENAELFRKAAEADAKRAEEEKANKGKKGWGFGGWFGGGGSKKESMEQSAPNKPIRAKLGEKSSFYYDPDQKRWINKAGGTEDNVRKTATPPPPRSASRLSSGGTPPPVGTPPTSSSPDLGRLGTSGPPQRSVSDMGSSMGPPALPSAGGLSVPLIMRSVSSTSAGGTGPASAPPSRPATSMSNASSIDDLLGAAGPRKGKGGAKSKKKGGRYVDVMAK